MTSRLVRWALRLGLWLLALTLAIVLGFTLFAVSALPPLQPWHTELLRKEFSADAHDGLDFVGYRKLEAELFDELAHKTDAWVRDGHRWLLRPLRHRKCGLRGRCP